MPDRADRLSQRRKDRSADQSAGQAQPEEQDQPEKQEKPEEPAESEQQEREAESAKDQYKGTYIYLPPDLRTEFDLVASELDTQRQRRNGKEVEKIRHFEPLVVALGLEQIDALDDDELEQRLVEFDP